MSESKTTNQEVFDRIKAEHIVPKPRWQFLVRNYAIWTAGFFALLFGAISVALTLNMILHNDLAVLPRFGNRQLELLLLAIPFFWLICLAVFIVLIYINVKHTKKGYRYSLPMILLFTILANLVLGGSFYLLGLGEKVDDLLSRHAPFYDQVIDPRVRFWSNPVEGRLSGLIIAVNNGDEYRLVDLKREEWLVFTKGAKKGPGAELLLNQPARFIGHMTADHGFSAEEILSVRSGRGFFNRFGPNSAPPPALPMFLSPPQN